MSWDKSARPKKLRSKQKRIVLWVSFLASIVLVSAMGVWKSFTVEDSFSAVVEFVGSILSDEEKTIVWEGMSDEGKAIILKHAPDKE